MNNTTIYGREDKCHQRSKVSEDCPLPPHHHGPETCSPPSHLKHSSRYDKLISLLADCMVANTLGSLFMERAGMQGYTDAASCNDFIDACHRCKECKVDSVLKQCIPLHTDQSLVFQVHSSLLRMERA